jgi:hypothetical protein
VCSQQAVSLVECGHGDRISVRTLDRVLKALDAEADVVVRWRGGQLDRLLDEGHAALVGITARRLEEAGWLVHAEVTYAGYRDGGSIDLLAFHPARAALLVVEIKTELLSAEATLRKHDEKVRVARAIAEERFGWRAVTVSRLLVLPAASSSRRSIARHAALFDSAYPISGWDVRRWLAEPVTSVSALLFVSSTKSVGGRPDLGSRRRIRSGRRPQG